MLRRILFSLLAVALLAGALPFTTGVATAAERANRTRTHAPQKRSVVVVRRGFPLRRAPRAVVVRPARVAVRIAPRVFLAPVVFSARIVRTRPAPDLLTWQDSADLFRDEGWTEITLDADARGRELYYEVVDGRVQVDWAEVVFDNGETTVVDFRDGTQGRGLYDLLDFRDGRRVDHVRLVVRARSDEATVALRLLR